MLKKRLGVEGIEKDWWSNENLINYFKIPSPLIIPDGCEKIGRYAFCNCWKLKKVIIPKSVKIIGDCAFYHCHTATIILKKPKRKFRYFGDCAYLGCSKVRVIL